MFRKYPQLFTDPGLTYPIGTLDRPFADYITACQTLIATTRRDLGEHAESIIEANSPFELRPTGKPKFGALLVHGLLDSPFVMRDIAYHLKLEGGLSRAILLPGHGTVPGGLLSVDYHDWLQTVYYGVSTLAQEVDKIFLVGFSTGATLALYYALHKVSPITGLIFAAPALKIHSAWDFALNWYRLIGWAWPRANWFNIQEENSNITYKSLAFNGAYQLYRLLQEINKKGKTTQPSCPLLFALSEEDVTVSSQTSIRYFQTTSHPNSRLILYSNRAKNFSDSRILQRPAAYPGMRIENMSHLCIPISPDNTYYGKHGSYIYASHVEAPEPIIYTEATQTKIDFYNFLYQLNWRSTQYSRLTFNPDFDYFMQTMKAFLANAL